MTSVVFGWLLSGTASAQQLELPELSPAASVMQRVGLTDFTVTYHSPGKKSRTVWGDLVPYDAVWRTGANEATVLEASGDFTFGGTAVPAGKYGLFTIPGKDQWTVILNKTPDQWGAFDYDQAKDQLRVQVKPETGPERERMTFLFSDTDDKGTRLDLEWAGVHVGVPIAVDTDGQVKAKIDTFVDDTGDTLASAARYRLEHGDVAGALVLADRSLAIKESWYNTWLKADALHQQAQDNKTAYKLALRAQELGTAAGDDFFWKDKVAKAVTEWKKK